MNAHAWNLILIADYYNSSVFTAMELAAELTSHGLYRIIMTWLKNTQLNQNLSNEYTHK